MSQNSSGKPVALIVSGEKVLKNILKEELRKIECSVETKDHRDTTKDLITSLSVDPGKSIDPTYFIWIMGNLGLMKRDLTESLYAKESIISSINNLKRKNSRCVFVFPYIEAKEYFSKTSEILSLLREAGFEKDILVVGDICTESDIDKYPEETSLDDYYRDYFPLNLKELSSEIIKSLFTLSEKKPRALISKKFSSGEVRKLFKKNNNLTSENNISVNFKKRRIKSKIYLKQNIDDLIDNLGPAMRSVESYNIQKISQKKDQAEKEKLQESDYQKVDLSKTTVSKIETPSVELKAKKTFSDYFSSIKLKNTSKKLIEKKGRLSKKLKLITVFLLISVVLVLLSPFVLLKLSEKILSSIDFENISSHQGVERKVRLSSPMLNILQGELSLFSKVGILKEIYQDKEKEAVILQKYKDYKEDDIAVKKKSDDLIQKLFEKSVSKNEVKDVELSLKNLSEKGAFLVSEMTNFAETLNYQGFFDKSVVFKVNSFRKRTYLTYEFLSNSEKIFGFDEEKKYLLVLSDSSLVRPSGGVIKEFAIISITEGRIDKVDIYDSNAITEKMKGYVVAPTTLYNFIGGESWNVEDASWSTSYEETSDRIKQFMQNSVTPDIDGVFTINNKFVEQHKKLLTSGSDYSNFYENDDISILNQFITSIYKVDMINGSFVEFLGKQIQRKNLLIHFFDLEINQKVDALNWSDNYYFGSCGEYCYADFIKLTEFELSDSYNVYIRRMGSFIVSIEGGLIKRNYMLTLVNDSDYIYKSYLRVSVPKDSGFAPVKIFDVNGESRDLLSVKGEKDRKEAGIYVEVNPGENKRLIFSWEGGFFPEIEKLNRYELNLVKQSGVDEVDTTVKIMHHKEADVVINGHDFLTNEKSLLYNSSLLTDEVIQVTFK